MKRSISFVMFLFILSICDSQDTSRIITYAGGYNILTKNLVNYVYFNYGFFQDSARAHNRYFQAKIKIDKNGFFKSEMELISINNDTSTIGSIIVEAIKKTSGKWINHSGKDQIVILPVYFIYKDENTKSEPIPEIKNEIYLEAKKFKPIYLQPIEIDMYPTVHKSM